MSKTIEPAFPYSYVKNYEQVEGGWLPKDTYIHAGLTKREYFAAMAMQGILSNQSRLADYDKRNREAGASWTLQQSVAVQALSYADMLLASLAKAKE